MSRVPPPQTGRIRRIMANAKAAQQNKTPNAPIRGMRDAVLGSLAGAASAGAAAAAGAGAATGTTTATRTGTSAGGGGGGMVPVVFFITETDVTGSSTTFVAEIFIPGFRPKASVSWPLIVNFWPLGILKRSTELSSRRSVTASGGVT